MARRVPRSFINQANAQSNVKFGPELDALKYIIEAAQQTRTQNIHNARNAAHFLVRTAAQAQQPLIDGYKRLMGSVPAAISQYSQDMNHVATAADQSGAIRDEARIAADNMGLSAQAALSMLAQTQVRAAAEGNYQVNKAQAAYDATRSQVAQRYNDIQGQAGTYGASVLQSLLGDQRKRQFTANQNQLNRQSREKIATQRINASNRRSTRGTLPGGAKPLPISQQNSIFNQIGEAQTWIERLSASQHMTSHDIRAHLQAGDTLTDASGNKIKLPKLPKLVVNAAYDLHAFGGLSRANVVALHKAGVRIKGRVKILTPQAQQMAPMAGVFQAPLPSQ